MAESWSTLILSTLREPITITKTETKKDRGKGLKLLGVIVWAVGILLIGPWRVEKSKKNMRLIHRKWGWLWTIYFKQMMTI